MGGLYARGFNAAPSVEVVRYRISKVNVMAEVTGIIGTTTAASTVRAAPSSASSANAQTDTTAALQVRPLSPAMRFDPVAGVVITEYLNSSGDVDTQIPSAASVAYLRVGLTASGQQPDAPSVDKNGQTEKTV